MEKGCSDGGRPHPKEYRQRECESDSAEQVPQFLQ